MNIYKEFLDSLPEIIYEVNCDGHFTYWNRSALEITGYTAEDLSGDITNLSLIAPGDRERASANMQKLLRGESVRGGEYGLIKKDGSIMDVSIHSSAIIKNGVPSGIRGILVNITEKKQIEKKLRENEETIRQLAYFDLLTGLPNRLLLEKRIEELISFCNRNGQKFGVLFLDLDNFKRINDTLGHQTGDSLLMEVGGRLKIGARKYDIMARIGGDEFAIVLPDVKIARNIGRFAERLLKLFARPFDINDHSIHVSPSIGISVYPDDGQDAGEIMQNADTAMYNSKYNGRNNYQFFNSLMKEEITKKVNIEKNLRRALQNEEFTLNYQPLFSTKTGKIRGFEALIRWTCPEIGNVPPSEFIPVAEECGLIVPIGEWVLKTACLKKKQWEMQHNSKALISVNISALHFKQGDFVPRVRWILAQTGLAPEYLELEITESILINCLDDIVKKLDDLRKTGVRISLDDFGTGYSSLNYLRILPLDTLKIDKTFIHGINSQSQDHYFVKSIVSLVQKYKLDIVAEGVETPEQLDYLAKCRCNYVQGFLLGRPVAEFDAAGILSRGRVDIKGFLVS